jgi:hypothetical protein
MLLSKLGPGRITLAWTFSGLVVPSLIVDLKIRVGPRRARTQGDPLHYRNFIRRPAPDQWFGSDRANRLAAQARKLDIRLALPFGGSIPEFNEGIPSGYTYLSQFLVHDCIFSMPSTPVAAALAQPIENLRRRPLQLDTLYGAGPEGFPIAYLPHRSFGRVRTKFKLSGEDRDIGRGRMVNSEGEGATEALIADPRNDVHASIAQITMLFQVFHNVVLDQLVAMFDCESHPHSEVVDHALFLSARSITTDVFRRIVRYDLLPRLLHPIVYDRYFERGEAYLDRLDLSEMPWEFAQAFRFGHVMVRPLYVVNPVNPEGETVVDMMLATSLRRTWRTPLDESWMIQWSQFFELSTPSGSSELGESVKATTTLNLSRRIRPSVTSGLQSSTLFSPFDRNNAPGLIYRDLISSTLNGCWSVAPLIAEIAERDPGLAPLLQGIAAQCKNCLHGWLADHRKATQLADDEIVEIGRDPPLLVYVLMEAACATDGRSLGPLGSIIVAEVLRKALDDDHLREIPLSAVAARLNCNFRPAAVRSMPDLIRYISKYAMTSATPVFV